MVINTRHLKRKKNPTEPLCCAVVVQPIFCWFVLIFSYCWGWHFGTSPWLPPKTVLYSHNWFSHLLCGCCKVHYRCVSVVSDTSASCVTFWRFHLDDDVKKERRRWKKIFFWLAFNHSLPSFQPPDVVNVIGRGHVRPAVDMAILEVRPAASGSVIRFHRDSESLSPWW